MDLKRILDARPEPHVVDQDQFTIDPEYQGSNRYNILTPMSDFQKELTDQIVSLHYSDILKFFERVDDTEKSLTGTQEHIILDSLHTMLTNAQLVTSHPYLVIKHYYPRSLSNRDLPKRLAETSGKFQVLMDILNVLASVYNPKDKNDHSKDRYPHINVGIVAKEGKTLDLVNSLCTGCKCYIKRYSGVKVRDSSAKQKDHMKLHVTAHLFPSSMEKLNEKEFPDLEDGGEPLKLNFLILFDLTADADNPKLMKYTIPGITKTIRPVPINSVDHIALYFRHLVQNRNYREYLKPVVAAVVVMRGHVGQIPSILKPVYTGHLNYLADWFRSPLQVAWPLPDMPSISTFNGKDVEHSLLTEVKFNFDNKDFLKEEAESKGEPKELNLNFNFHEGKTIMVNHIVQPRFCGKNERKLDFYEEKRWQKKYLTNPLHSDYYKLTGISKEVHQNEILTHTLIYNLTMKMTAFENMNTELKTFDDTFQARMREFRIMRLQFDKISHQLNEMDSHVKDKTSRIESLDKEIEDLKQKITELKDQIGNIVKTHKDSSLLTKKWIEIDKESSSYRDKISKEQQESKSYKDELNFMSSEIGKAEKSIAKSKESLKMKRIKEEELQSKIERLSCNHTETENNQAKLSQMKDMFEKSRNKHIELVDRLNLTLKRLVEASTGRSRYVNYATGGLRG